ncbi:MAG: ATP-binding protein, partial [Planctomycetales bacterium]|nr:ATP-binding protein [Planctomycetales bacterium]
MPSGRIPAALLVLEIRGLSARAEGEGPGSVARLLDALPAAAGDSVGRAGGALLGLAEDVATFGFGGRHAHPSPGKSACASAPFLLRRLAESPFADTGLAARIAVLPLRGTDAKNLATVWKAPRIRTLMDRALKAAGPGEALLASELRGDLPSGLPAPKPRAAGPSRYLGVAAGGPPPAPVPGPAPLARVLTQKLAAWRGAAASRERRPVALLVAVPAGRRDPSPRSALAAESRRSGAVVRALPGRGAVAIFGVEERAADAGDRALRAGLRLRRPASGPGPSLAAVAAVVPASSLGGTVRERRPPLAGLVAKARALASSRAAPGRLLAVEGGLADVLPLFRTEAATPGVREVVELGPGRWRGLWARAGRLGGEYVGRRSELRSAEEGLEGLAQGKGSRYLVLGGPGSGKSAFLAEWRRTAEAAGLRVAQGAYDPALPRVPYAALREAVADLLGLPARFGEAEAAEAVARRFGALALKPDGPRARAIAALLTGRAAAPLDRFSAPIRERLLREALREWIAAEAARKPVVLLLDNAHVADPASRRLLPALAASLKPAPVIVGLSGRPGPGEPTLSEVRRIRLGFMTPTDLRELARRGLSGAAPSAALLQYLAGPCQGIPGPAVEHLHEAAAGGELIPPPPPSSPADSVPAPAAASEKAPPSPEAGG